MRRTFTQVIGAIAVEDRDGVAVREGDYAAFYHPASRVSTPQGER